MADTRANMPHIPPEIKITQLMVDGPRTWARVETPEFTEVLWVSGAVYTAAAFYNIAQTAIERMRAEVA